MDAVGCWKKRLAPVNPLHIHATCLLEAYTPKDLLTVHNLINLTDNEKTEQVRTWL